MRDIILNELGFIWNAWDEKKHPRDSKGRFTFVLGLKSNYGSSAIGGTVIGKSTISEARKALQVFAGKSIENKAQYEGEKEDIAWYQTAGYKTINDELRSGGTIEDAMCEKLNDACRFSSDEPLTVMRGESSFSNNWENIKPGTKMPDGLKNAFISTSTDQNVAESFASKKRDADPEGKSKLYETVVTINVSTSQRFGIPNAYGDSIASGESEIILPYGTNGIVKKITQKEVKINNRIVVQQSVTIDII